MGTSPQSEVFLAHLMIHLGRAGLDMASQDLALNTEMPYMNSMPILPNNTVRREKKLLTHGVSEDFQDHTVAPIMISQPHVRTSLQLRSGKLTSVKAATQNQSAKENNYRSAMANQSYLILQQQQKKQQLASKVMQINLQSLNQIQEYVNQTVRIRGMRLPEALSMVNLSNCSRANKEYLFAEIVNASTASSDSAASSLGGRGDKKVVDHVRMLQTIAEYLDELTQTKQKDYARRNRDNLTVKERYAEQKRAEKVVSLLHSKLGLNKYYKTFASVEKSRPDLLILKGYIEGLPVEEDSLNSLERTDWVRKKLSTNPNIFAFMRERDNSRDSDSNSTGSADTRNKEKEKKQFKKNRL